MARTTTSPHTEPPATMASPGGRDRMTLDLQSDAGTLLGACRAASAAVDTFLAEARMALHRLCSDGGRVEAALVDRHQGAAHGFSWMATYGEALRQLLAWGERLDAA